MNDSTKEYEGTFTATTFVTAIIDQARVVFDRHNRTDAAQYVDDVTHLNLMNDMLNAKRWAKHKLLHCAFVWKTVRPLASERTAAKVYAEILPISASSECDIKSNLSRTPPGAIGGVQKRLDFMLHSLLHLIHIDASN